MATNTTIIKSNGQLEAFDPAKLRHSLLRAGAAVGLAEAIVHSIQDTIRPGDTTRLIYRKAFRLLKKASDLSATRFTLKQAIDNLGPTGYPFETLVGEILRNEGYTVTTGQILQGRWVTHEVDVVADKEGEQLLIECKFHNHAGRVSDVKVPLYVNSRFQDIHSEWERTPEPLPTYQQGGIFTNTRFTTDAMQYGKGVGLRLVSWNFPYQENLPFLLEKYQIYPVTTLTSLTAEEHKDLLDKKIVLCSQLNSQVLNTLPLSQTRRIELEKELDFLGGKN
jgi:hypothetical protein